MNLVGYTRVSTAAQVDDGLGLEVQTEAIEQWCAQHGHELVAVHRDEGISGAKEQADRPGLGAALAACEDLAEGLVVYRLDRLARHLVVQETIIEQLTRRGRRVFSTREDDIDDEDPTRVLIRQVLGVIAQYERALITARLQAGRHAKAARGGFAFGSPGFGWRSEAGELVVDEREQQAIARMIELRNGGASLRVIARTLDAEGITPKRAARWHSAMVGRVLARLDAARSD